VLTGDILDIFHKENDNYLWGIGVGKSTLFDAKAAGVDFKKWQLNDLLSVRSKRIPGETKPNLILKFISRFFSSPLIRPAME
jgi:hypothetical protein